MTQQSSIELLFDPSYVCRDPLDQSALLERMDLTACWDLLDLPDPVDALERLGQL